MSLRKKRSAALACVNTLRREGVQPQVWSVGERRQRGLRELAARHPALQIKIGVQPCAPSIAFQLGDDSAAAKNYLGGPHTAPPGTGCGVFAESNVPLPNWPSPLRPQVHSVPSPRKATV